MADQHLAQSSKKSRGFLKHLRKVLRPKPSNTVTPQVDLAPTTTNLEEGAKLRSIYTHFRILVIGRANAGKTTLLKRVCNTKEDPVYNMVRYQLRFIPHSYPYIDRLSRPRRYHLFTFLWLGR